MILLNVKKLLFKFEQKKIMKNRPKTFKVELIEKQYSLSITELKIIQDILKSDLNFNIEFALAVAKKIKAHKINS